MNGAADEERLWWTMESEFDVAQFDKYEFNQKYVGPVAATAYKTSFTWRVALFPKGGAYDKGVIIGEVRDHIGVGIKLVGGSVDDLGDVKYSVKVYKADGELQVMRGRKQSNAVTFNLMSWWGAVKGLPMARDQLRAYLITEEGVEYVRVRVEVGIPKAAFEPLSLLPPLPTPHQDMAERFSRWSSSDDDLVKVVAGDGKKFTIYKGQLTEASDVFKAMLKTAMKEGRANCIHMDDLCGDALDELISYITFSATRPSRVRQHALKLLDVSQRYLLPDLKIVCERAVVSELQKKLPIDVLKLLAAAETYELRVAMDVGLCRLIHAFHQLSNADQDRFNSPDFTAIRKRFTNLSTQSLLATKRQV